MESDRPTRAEVEQELATATSNWWPNEETIIIRWLAEYCLELMDALEHIADCDSPRMGPKSRVEHMKRVARAALLPDAVEVKGATAD